MGGDTGRPVQGAGVRSIAIAAVVLIASLASALVSAPAGDATFAGRNGHLLWFLNGTNGQAPLWVSGGDGQHAHKLRIRPRCGLRGAAALFTRSGGQIIFQEFVNCSFAEFAVERTDLDGRHARTLARFTTVPRQNVLATLPGTMALSPDGRTLAYGFNESGRSRGTVHKVVFISVQAGSKTRSITMPGPASGPTWVSEHKLLFRLDTGVIETTRLDGSHPHHIRIRFAGVTAQSPITIQDVVPSPDGSRLAVTAGTSSGCGEAGEPQCTADIYVVPAKGGKARRLTHSGAVSAPVWSPDGRKIAYHDGTANKLVTVAGDRVTKLAPRIPSGGLGVVDWQALP